MRAMSDMDYKEAWRRLQDKMNDKILNYLIFTNSPLVDGASKRRVEIRLATVDEIFAEMNLIEKKMTTALDDDGQGAQD